MLGKYRSFEGFNVPRSKVAPFKMQTTQMQTVLKVTNLTKDFGERRAVDSLDFEIERGEIFGLLGPNGAGKTTTIQMAVGLLPPDLGDVDVMGRGSPDQRSVRKYIGVTPQELAFYGSLTAEENLLFFGKLQELSGAELKLRVDEALDFVRLSDRRRDIVETFSGGMKRRLNMAIALLHRPEIVLLDEPTVGVDPQSRNAIFDNILALQDDGKTMIYTSHYMEEVEKLCHRVAIIDQGKLLALDTVDNLVRAHGGERTVVASTNEGEQRIPTRDPLAELNQLDKAGNLRHFSVEEPNLEKVFLNLTGRSLRD